MALEKLIDAIKCHDTEEVVAIINYESDNPDFDVNGIEAGLTPLCVACQEKQPIIVSKLLNFGADPNFPTGVYDKCPIHYACDFEDHNLKIVEYLVEAGANINVLDLDGNTGLHIACTQGNIPVAKYLIDQNASVNINDIDDESPLARACFAQNLELIKLLLENGSYKDDTFPLRILVGIGLIEGVKLLIEAGFNISGKSYLAIASEQSNIEMMEFLKDLGADVNETDGIFKFSPLHRIILNHSYEYKALIKLLEWGADVNQISITGDTPLHYASQQLSLEKVTALVLYGADLNIIDSAGYSPLTATLTSIYVYESLVLISRLLIFAGSKVRQDDIHLFLSQHQHQPKDQVLSVVDMLQECSGNPLSLKYLCRIQIRNVLRSRYTESIDKLPLPKALKKFLNFEDVPI